MSTKSGEGEPVTDAIPVRTYELDCGREGTYRIELPETFKVTFGPIMGAGGKDRAVGSGGNAFRAWEAETKQRFLATGVVAFRDISIPMLIGVVRRFGSQEWFVDDGSWVGPRAAEVEHGWRNIEDPSVSPTEPDRPPTRGRA